ncbi:MAG TPA: NAD(P)/FAD-dependent oxidoreductase [Pyrinomonadaceae bacterium]|nr:NAD(P)/FAD-dependent oxidoreductase [Pyrinomonadaceae bacterium]
MREHESTVVIIGGGPAGLTAAYELCKAGRHSVVLERDASLGGLARTVNYKGFRFDIGGHRFFTKSRAVEETWREVLSGGEFLRRKRLSRIYYNKRFFHYPLRASSMLSSLGWWDAAAVLASYLRARLRPRRPEETFEQWVTNRFGRRLYEIFFKTYTEKVWGIPCDEITADWAAQRIKGLSLAVVLKDVLLRRHRANGAKGGGGDRDAIVRTLVDEFDYPRLGPGQMWERMAELCEATGLGRVRTGASVERVRWRGGRVESVEVADAGGRRETIEGEEFISSMPARELVAKLEPAAPPEVAEAAARLRYRDFLTVVLVVDRPDVFPDNWIYIHDPAVKLGRVQNFKNWSADMVPDASKSCLGLEYFCFEGDGLWQTADAELIELGKRELGRLGLVRAEEVEDGTVFRMPKAYPVYDSEHKGALAVLRRFFDSFENLQLVGRNGLHRYNNQDHSMMTAMLAARNVLGESHDLWAVNADPEYHEECAPADAAAARATQRHVPERVSARAVENEA